MKDHVPFRESGVCPACGGSDANHRHTISGTIVKVGFCVCTPKSRMVIARELQNPILIAGFVAAFKKRTGYPAVVYNEGEHFPTESDISVNH